MFYAYLFKWDIAMCIIYTDNEAFKHRNLLATKKLQVWIKLKQHQTNVSRDVLRANNSKFINPNEFM